jgi:hypothetical protein
MKLPARIVACLLPWFLTACFHKTDQTLVRPLAPPIEDAPLPKPIPSPTDLPPSVISIPRQTPAQDANTQPYVTPKPPVRHKKPAPNNTQQAYAGSPSVSAIGQLSSGDPSDLRRQTMTSIAATERGLSGISRQLSEQEHKTAERIREFLKQARAALASGDVDGAYTLAAKARVLLGELNP